MKINGEHGHADIEITAIFQNSNRHRVRTCESLNYSNGATHGELGGTQMGPVAIPTGSASPTWDMEVSRREAVEMLGKMGAGYLRQYFELQVGYRPVGGLARQNDIVESCKIEDDGISSSKGDAVKAAMKGKCLKAKYNGMDPFGDDEDEA